MLTGALQIAGSVGLLVGFAFEGLAAAAALGLAILMLLGTGVRIKIHDPFVMILPAFGFMVLNFVIFLMETKLLHDFQLAF